MQFEANGEEKRKQCEVVGKFCSVKRYYEENTYSIGLISQYIMLSFLGTHGECPYAKFSFDFTGHIEIYFTVMKNLQDEGKGDGEDLKNIGL